MILNYLLSALRNLWRNKLITLINFLGMAIGFGIFLILLGWIRFDGLFDKFHKDIDRMYVLNVRLNMNNAEYTSQRTGGVYSGLLKELYPEIENSCRVSQPMEFELGIPVEDAGEAVPMKYLDESLVLMVDSNFFSFFTFPLLEGDPKELFRARNDIVITESLARRLFGEGNAMGRTVRIGEGGYFTVAAVAKDPPVTSTYQFRALLGFHILEEMGYPVDGYGGTMYFNNFKLAEGSDLTKLNTSINVHVQANFESDFDARYFLDPLDRMHLHGETSQQWIGYMINVIAMAVILLIACINFINLSTAGSSQRLKEIAIRKSAGAGKGQLVLQFMGETYILLLVALYMGFFIAEQLEINVFPYFEIKQSEVPRDLVFWLLIAGIYLLTGLIAGLYPALKISAFRPLAFFSGKGILTPRSGARSRRVLIVIQFAFSIFFITISIFIIRQFTHMRQADLGFNRENVLYIKTKGKVWDLYPAIKQELEQLSFVEKVSSASDLPVQVNYGDIDWGERDGDHNKFARVIRTSPDFLSTFDIGLLEGDYFSDERDTLNFGYVVVNRAVADYLGWKDPVGRKMYIWGSDRIILGVTGDINFYPVQLDAFSNDALIYVYEPVGDFVFLKVVPGTTAEQFTALEDVFRKYNPGYELEYDFVSNYDYAMLGNESAIGFFFRLFSGIAIFIAIMGLIGLSQFNNSRRTKEMGIHKVMGAHTRSVISLLLTEFIRLVILSNLVALPLAYFVLSRIFRFFTYSTELKIPVFLIVFVLSVLLTMATVMFHALRTARANPVNSLRYE